MSSLWKSKATINLTKQNTRPSPSITNIKKYFAQNIFPFNLTPYKKSIKRMSPFPPFQRYHKASMTLEAAIILPLFIFFFLNLTSAIEMMRLHGNLELALWRTGSPMAIYGHAYEGPENRLMGIAFSYLYVRNEIVDYLGEEYLNDSPLTRGADGLIFLESSFLEENDCIDLVVTYEVSPFFAVPGFSSFRIANRYYARAWTGYEIPAEENEEGKAEDYVYITETGTVYHETKECTYLALSIQGIQIEEISGRKNAEGRSYSLCWLCRDAPFSKQVYITETGNRFHYSQECSGLKRTIYSVLRSQAGEYRACKRCKM